MRISTALLLGAAVASIQGCSVVKKSTECRSISAAINPHTVAVRKLSAGLSAEATGDQVSKAFLSMASEVEAGAAEVKQLNLETPEIRDLGERYQAMCAASSLAFRGMVAASRAVLSAQKLVDAHDPAGQEALAKANATVTAAQDALQAATEPELAIVKGLNKFCDTE